MFTQHKTNSQRQSAGSYAALSDEEVGFQTSSCNNKADIIESTFSSIFSFKLSLDCKSLPLLPVFKLEFLDFTSVLFQKFLTFLVLI